MKCKIVTKIDIIPQTCDGYLLKTLFAAGFHWLQTHQETVNRLNVFPVPDGDTGTNMTLTMRRAYAEIRDIDDSHVGRIASAIAYGALRGGRGNSGVILSELLKGFAATIADQTTFDAKQLSRACNIGVEYAYKAVQKPTEGTLLTVSREASEALAAAVTNGETTLLPALDTLLKAARASLARTPELLPALKDAGVHDSGGQGLVYILEGMQRVLNGQPVILDDIPEATLPPAPEPRIPFQVTNDDDESYGYDVQFLMYGDGLDINAVRRNIEAMGWSTVITGDAEVIKVHVHVHNPGEPLSYAIGTGAVLDDVVVENMQLQSERNTQQQSSSGPAQTARREIDGVAVVTVASGDGICRILRDEMGAAKVIYGGQTMNPSAENFLEAIESLPNDEIILLPNNKNILMAAQQAASLATDKQVRVVPTTNFPQAITAMLVYMTMVQESDLDTLVETMNEEISHVVAGEITIATRDSHLNGIRANNGQYIGLLGGKIVAAGDSLATVLNELLAKAGEDDHELVTLYYGEDITFDDATAIVDGLRDSFQHLEFNLIDGGQPLYPFLVSVE